MLRKEVLVLLQGLKDVSAYPGVKFAYCVAKNTLRCTEEAKALEATLVQSNEFSKYNAERIKLAEKYANKEENGQYKIVDNAYDFTPENKAKFVTEELDLRSQYKDAVDGRNKQAEEYNALLEEKSDVVLYKISIDLLPADITASQLLAIMPIVEDEEPATSA